MLHNSVSVYVPSTRHSVPIPDSEHNRYVCFALREFSAHFGGATAIPASGAWLSDSAGLIQERITIVKSYYPDGRDSEAVELAQSIARTIKLELSQEAVTVETTEGLDFI